MISAGITTRGKFTGTIGIATFGKFAGKSTLIREIIRLASYIRRTLDLDSKI